jgi:uncharacterized protein YhaN
LAENEAQVASIKGKYPYGLPAQNELQQVKSSLAEEQKLHGKSTQKVFGEADEQKYQSLCATFARGVPDEQSVAQTEQNMARHAALCTQISLSEGAEVPEREARLTRKFASGVPSSKELEEVEKTIEQYKEAEKVCNETPATIPQITTTSAPKKGGAQKLFILWAVVSVLLIAAAFVRLFVWQATDVVLFVLGGVSLLACGFVFLYKKAGGKHVAETVIQVENPAKRQAEQKKAELENNIRAFLLPYGYASTNGVLFDFATLKEDVNFYISYLAIEKARLAQLEKNKQEADLCEQAINGFFARFGYGGNEWVKNLSSLRADAKLYEDLQFRKQNAVAEQQNLKTQREQNLQPVVAFCEKYHIAYENVERAIGEMETDGVRLAELQKKVLADTGKIQAFQQEKNLTERPAAQDADIGALNARLHALQQAQSGRLREITEDEVQAERLDDLQNELEVAEEKLGDYKKKFELLTTSIEMLKQADYSLKERYIKPVKDSFLKYSDLLERALGEKVTMSKDFEIRYERNGKERSERHLSAGQRSLCALCFRLALIDNMYAAEKPFLILDDPFVNLDSEHLERAKGLLRELAKDGQILYFTCHPSRAIAAKG